MPKISLDNLERYDGHLKDWCDARFAESKVHENWHEAGPSGAVSFYPIPNHPIDPVVNFAFIETLPEGTKGPDNPSTIMGISSITVTLCETVGVDETNYTVNLGDTYYGGSIDLSTGIMTVTWWGNVFNGTENWYLADGSTESIPIFGLNNNLSVVFLYPMSASISSSTRFCSHFPLNSSNIANTFSTWGTGNRLFIRIDGAVISTVGAFKNWVAQQYSNSTPLVLVYKLETPQIVQLTPIQIYSLSQSDPYSPNTVYSDQQSVIVRYPKSLIVTGSELDNAILSLGGD